ncbi:TPA: hypothetical protein ACTUT5_002587 [Legionella anisa]|uniref:Uncharacterized protein n=1 Tax=Legionella anisa TaxID=28082 RepID=A0AAX0WVM5_9GAMM|nr:hypothetical protein [Legionella anisa]AWN75021.1 hypothetical protein DLD14_14885 [Legionella anisa]MBN5933968.1 hypothetical protein [Legionella anisa]MCW8424776.1 hypothetical protein [Legionella anisa]MCW8446105.1 hypothetical protein [Legionella anisa]PNL61024.1 hypothetical protein A6J39_007255 [Legionella anisa]
MMIKTKIIKNDGLLKIYGTHYSSLAHNRSDLEYFKSSKVRIFFRDSEENMLAGFCINSGPNYRTFLPLNPSQLQELYSDYSFDQKKPHEITCLWIEKTSQHASWVVFLYFILFLDVLRLPTGPIIFGTHGKNINNFFSLPFPKIIFYEKLFVLTKGEECDFWIRKGSKLQFLRGFIVLATIRLFMGNKTLARFRLWLGKKKSN